MQIWRGIVGSQDLLPCSFLALLSDCWSWMKREWRDPQIPILNMYIYSFFYNFSSSSSRFFFWVWNRSHGDILSKRIYFGFVLLGFYSFFLIPNRKRETGSTIRCARRMNSFSRCRLDRAVDWLLPFFAYYKACKTESVENFFFPFLTFLTLIQTRQHG